MHSGLFSIGPPLRRAYKTAPVCPSLTTIAPHSLSQHISALCLHSYVCFRLKRSVITSC
jgi:hypothetical protein